MIIRGLFKDDIDNIQNIYTQYFSKEFRLNEFLDAHLIQGMVAVNEDNKIVCAAGIRTIAESVLMTDKSFSVRDRREALYKILTASAHICKNMQYNELHAFTQDKIWEKHLHRVGFHATKGLSLVLEL
jgi:hypothetical protein